MRTDDDEHKKQKMLSSFGNIRNIRVYVALLYNLQY